MVVHFDAASTTVAAYALRCGKWSVVLRRLHRFKANMSMKILTQKHVKHTRTRTENSS